MLDKDSRARPAIKNLGFGSFTEAERKSLPLRLWSRKAQRCPLLRLQQ